MLQAAARMAGGQWPYRDFWWNYGPGQPPVAGALAGGGVAAIVAAAIAGVVLWAPFLAVAPGDVEHDMVGFLRVQHLQRLLLPLDYDGPVDPNKVLEFYFPLVLLGGSALWLV